MNYQEFEDCAFNQFMKLFSGKWKPLILFHFFETGNIRFTELWRMMPVVSKKVLLEQLKELEDKGIVQRRQTNVFPPEVYYGLTDRGQSLSPLIQSIEKWIKDT